MKSISIEIVKMKTTFQVNAGCFHLRVRTRELNRHVAPFISEKAFQSDHLLHAMSRFCIEWTMLWCTMWTVKHVTGQRWKQYDILKAVVLGWLKLSCIVTYQGAKCVFVLAVPSSTAELPALPYLHFWNVNRCPGQESYK